jgi:vancomycin resistance protein YoaR
MPKGTVSVLSIIIILAMLLLPGAMAFAAPQSETLVFIDDGRIAQGVSIMTLGVSGLRADDAAALLELNSGAILENAALVLVLPDRSIEIPVNELPVSANLDEAVRRAMLVGRSGGISARLDAVTAASASGTTVAIPYDFNKQTLAAGVKAIADGIPRENQPGSLKFDPSLPERFAISDGVKGFSPDLASLIVNVEKAFQSGQINNVTVPGMQAKDNGVVTLKPGTAENTTLVGKFTTNVAGASGRVHNIKTGSGLINGKIVQPGEIFSVNDTLGPRVASAGIWKKAPALLNGDTVMELGGGICQVSTTLFNAVARANLEIVEWVHHSIPSSYVTIGCDATISTGGPDFRFKNNTDWPVYIVFTYADKTRKLTCEIWGRPLENGMRIEITGKQVGTKGMPAARYTDYHDEVMNGRIGRYSQTFRVWYDDSGKEVKRELIHENYYPARAPVILRTPTPSIAPSPPSP